jgi:hypothetical protein
MTFSNIHTRAQINNITSLHTFDIHILDSKKQQYVEKTHANARSRIIKQLMLCGCSFHFVLLLRGRARVVHCGSLKKYRRPVAQLWKSAKKRWRRASAPITECCG